MKPENDETPKIDDETKEIEVIVPPQDEVLDSDIETVEDGFTHENYGAIKDKSVFVDPTTNKIIPKEQLTPIQMIMSSAKDTGFKLKPIKFDKNGKYDTGCNKTGCYGRGYVGVVDGLPVPCSCIFYKEDKGKLFQFKPNRKQSREMERRDRQDLQRIKNLKAKELGLKQVDSVTWVDSKKHQFEWKMVKGETDFVRSE